MNRRLVDEIVTTSNHEIVLAMRFAFEELKLVLEPSGAAALAAVMAGGLQLVGRVVVILSGGNISAERFLQLIATPR